MIRIHNNTEFELKFLLDEQRHLINALVDTSQIESITFEETKTVVFGIDCVLAEFNPLKDLTLSAKLRWYDKASGDGMVRLASGCSKFIHFGPNREDLPQSMDVVVHADHFIGVSINDERLSVKLGGVQ